MTISTLKTLCLLYLIDFLGSWVNILQLRGHILKLTHGMFIKYIYVFTFSTVKLTC